MNWEDTFKSWAKAPSQSEKEKYENADRAVRKAVSGHSKFAGKSISVFNQGSYRHRTNTGSDSDVDMGVLCRDTFIYDLPPGFIATTFGINAATYSHASFKNDLHKVLEDHFGKNAVTRGNKAFDIHENTYRIDADVVPHFEYRRYNSDGTYITGTAFYADDGKRIINWPEHNYENGVTKNEATKGGFKGNTRVLKNLRAKMEQDGYAAAKNIPSFLVECLIWNVPNASLMNPTWSEDMRAALAYLFNNTMKFENCQEWGEVNELKYLFRSSQPWTREQAHNFVSAAWDYLGLK